MEDQLVAFLERLLGQPVSRTKRFVVSSTQRARLVVWLRDNGLSGNFNRFKSNLMSIPQILGNDETGDDTKPDAVSAPTISAPVAKGGVIGFGVDVQARSSLPAAVDYRGDSFYSANFTAREIAHCIQQSDPLQSFAGIWAAKEAAVKAGAGQRSAKGDYGHIEIVHNPDGAPGLDDCLISISHENGYAFAACVRLG